MIISATVIADSACAVTGERLTSLLLDYPRFIHGEFMTHREISSGQSVPPAHQNNPQFAPQNPNQQQPNFNNNMQGEPKQPPTLS